jgi:hypothetical protein
MRPTRPTILTITLLLTGAGCASMRRTEGPPPPPKAWPGKALSWKFDTDPVAELPPGWLITETNPTTAPAVWHVATDPTAPSPNNVLALVESTNTDGTFNLAVYQNMRFRNLNLTVAVKANNGTEDQGGGPVWRYVDENNYYVCRFNPLEKNFRLYKVVNGQRTQLQSADVEAARGQWCRVRVTMVGSRIACYLNEKRWLEADDDTFAEPGLVGLWTKADAVTAFDDLAINELSPH